MNLLAQQMTGLQWMLARHTTTTRKKKLLPPKSTLSFCKQLRWPQSQSPLAEIERLFVKFKEMHDEIKDLKLRLAKVQGQPDA